MMVNYAEHGEQTDIYYGHGHSDLQIVCRFCPVVNLDWPVYRIELDSFWRDDNVIHRHKKPLCEMAVLQQSNETPWRYAKEIYSNGLMLCNSRGIL